MRRRPRYWPRSATISPACCGYREPRRLVRAGDGRPALQARHSGMRARTSWFTRSGPFITTMTMSPATRCSCGHRGRWPWRSVRGRPPAAAGWCCMSASAPATERREGGPTLQLEDGAHDFLRARKLQPLLAAPPAHAGAAGGEPDRYDQASSLAGPNASPSRASPGRRGRPGCPARGRSGYGHEAGAAAVLVRFVRQDIGPIPLDLGQAMKVTLRVSADLAGLGDPPGTRDVPVAEWRLTADDGSEVPWPAFPAAAEAIADWVEEQAAAHPGSVILLAGRMPQEIAVGLGIQLGQRPDDLAGPGLPRPSRRRLPDRAQPRPGPRLGTRRTPVSRDALDLGSDAGRAGGCAHPADRSACRHLRLAGRPRPAARAPPRPACRGPRTVAGRRNGRAARPGRHRRTARRVPGIALQVRLLDDSLNRPAACRAPLRAPRSGSAPPLPGPRPGADDRAGLLAGTAPLAGHPGLAGPVSSLPPVPAAR